MEAATSEIFRSIGAGLSGSTGKIGQFVSKLFGGSRAMGGDVAAGKVYQVHPNEAFFEPGRSGFVAQSNGGLHIEIGQINADDAIGVRRAVAEGVMVAIKQAGRNTADMIDGQYRAQMA